MQHRNYCSKLTRNVTFTLFPAPPRSPSSIGRTTVGGRDDLLEDLSRERSRREELEGELEELLGGGLAVAMEKARDELEARVFVLPSLIVAVEVRQLDWFRAQSGLYPACGAETVREERRVEATSRTR